MQAMSRWILALSVIGCDGGSSPTDPTGSEVGEAADEGAGEGSGVEGAGKGSGVEGGEAPPQALPGPDEDFVVALPAPPAPPDLGTPDCPPGWTPEADAAPDAGPGPCVAPAEVVCEGANGQFASDSECVTIGTACPEAERFLPEAEIREFVSESDAQDAIIYVDVQAPAGGDGSRGRRGVVGSHPRISGGGRAARGLDLPEAVDAAEATT
jgi:hypothetical protein